MKKYFLIIAIFTGLNANAQADEIYKLVFSDTSNFRILNYLGHSIPSKFYVVDSTSKWNGNRFWIEGLGVNEIEKVKKLEHHPYNHTYIFRDSALNVLFSDDQKKALQKTAALLRSKKISIKGENYITVPAEKTRDGYHIIFSEPFFTRDKNFAFIDMVILLKEPGTSEEDDIYIGTSFIIYEKAGDGAWKKLKTIGHLIL
jgi:hypothetical protein